jgi:LemA protein
MKKGLIVGIIIGVLILLIGGYVISAYNNFISLDNGVTSSWSEVENQYQRQADLIPNLISVVSSSAKVETKYVTDVTNARTQWQSAKSISEKDLAGLSMGNGINAYVQAISTSESYPVLQANKQYTALTDELSGTQNRITVARGRYIESVKNYNVAVSRFPGNLLAGTFGFQKVDYYESKSGTDTPSIGDGKLPN